MDDGERRVMLTVLATCAAAILGLLVIAAWLIERGAGDWWRTPGRPARMAPAVAPPPADFAMAGATLRGNPGQSFGPDAYPADAIRAEAQGRTVARLAVDARGIPVGCTVVERSGWRSLDAATCSIALGNIRYAPARDARGRPITSTTRLPGRWVLPSS